MFIFNPYVKFYGLLEEKAEGSDAGGVQMSQATKEAADNAIDAAIEKALNPVIDKIGKAIESKIADITVTPSQKDTDNFEKKGFDNLGEFAQSVAKFCNGDTSDSRVKALLQTRVGEDGGILIPAAFSRRIFESAQEKSVLWKRITNVPVNTNSIEMPAISDYSHASDTYYGGVKNYWVQEGAVGTETAPKFDIVQLRLKDNMTLIPVTNDLLEDNPVALAPVIETLARNALSLAMDNVFLNGDGVGKPLGILNANAKVSVAKESEQSADTIVTNNILKMYARFNMGDMKKAVWLANRTVMTQLPIMNTASYNTVWMPPGGISGLPYNTLMGIPIEFTEFCKTLGDVGDIVLCDPSQYLAIDKAQKADWSKEVYFAYNKSLFRLIYRVDGQMWQNKVFTPANGDTLAPIVTLATR